MTISSQTSKAAFSGNGVSTAFPLPFPYLREADIKALLRHEGFETPLELGTHYALNGAGSAQGGALVMNQPPATGQTLVVYRAPAIVQEVDYVENSAFPAETHEAALDLLTMICQSLQEQLGRAVLYPVSTPATEVLDSHAFLAATAHSRDAARVAEQNAAGSAGQAGLFASQAAASAASAEAVANTADGLVKVSVGDAAARSLSSKLLAGNGLAEGIENPGGDEALRLAIALADDSGLEFEAGLLRVKAGTGLALAASGLVADVGTGPGQLVQLDANGRLPALDARNLTNSVSVDQQARDNAAMHAFLAWLSAGRASGPVPGGGLYTFKSAELTATGASYDATGDYYTNYTDATTDIAPTATITSTGTVLNSSVPASLVDGNNTTYFAVSGATSSFIFDYGVGGKNIRSLTFIINAGTGAQTFRLQYSDLGSVWVDTNVISTVSPIGATGVTVSVNDYGKRRYWRVLTETAGLQATTVNLYERVAGDMTLIPGAGVTLGQTPAKAALYLLHKAVDALTLNTDIKVSASRGDGWIEATDLAALCQYDADYTLLRASVDLSALPAGSNVAWRVQTINTKAQRVRAALLWAE